MKKAYAAVDLKDAIFGGHSGAASVADSPTSLISAILPNILTFASLILLLYLVFGGFLLITSGNVEQTQKGQQSIFNAIIGFVIIFTSYWIIQIVQIILALTS
jgi:heme/copper-type cytochrome/quinol oxidase subunit 4